MTFGATPPRPPRGSTDWGARQFYRLLDEEERIAAERERLRALGWRPPSPSNTQPAPSGEATFERESNPYVDFLEQGLALEHAAEAEARRRAGAVPRSSIKNTDGLIGGGRFAVPLPPDRPASDIPGSDSSAGLYTPVRSAAALRALLAWLLTLGGAEAGRKSTEPNYDFGIDLPSSDREVTPPETSVPPQHLDPELEEELSRPLPGYPDQSDEISGTIDAPENIPLPDDVGGQMDRPESLPYPNELIGPHIRITLPEIIDKFWQAGILIRNELPSTRQDNEDIIKIIRETMAECGWNAEHKGGASEKERYLSPGEGQKAGGRYTDGTVVGLGPNGEKVIYDFNTARLLKNGRWAAYEERAAAAIRVLKFKIDGLRTRFSVHPKSYGMDRELWREEVRPYVQQAVRALLNC